MLLLPNTLSATPTKALTSDSIQMNEVDVMAFDQSKYISDFMKEKYDRIVVQVPKGKKDRIKQAAKQAGISMNQAVIEALEQTYHIDLSRPE